VFISLKDSRGTPENHEFLLAGDGETDYTFYFGLLKELGYNGFVSIEVSSMIQRKPGYDPVAAARLCYDRLAPLFAKAGVTRRRA
jgi:inosose dehydratase